MVDLSFTNGFALNNLVFHLYQAGKNSQLAALFDKGQFLSKKANATASLDLLEDLETYLLPVLSKQRDWTRFVQFALIAANLRGLGEKLQSGDLLEVIAREKSPGMSRALCRQISGSASRAAARARFAKYFPEAPEFSLERICGDMALIQQPEGEQQAEVLAQALDIIAETVGLHPTFPWPVWLDWIAGTALASKVQAKLIFAWAAHEKRGLKVLQEILSRVSLPESLADHLLENLQNISLSSKLVLLNHLSEILGRTGEYIRVCLILLGKVVTEEPKQAALAFEEMCRHCPWFAWTYQTTEWALDFLCHVQPTSPPITPAAQAVITVARLTRRPTANRAAEAHAFLTKAPAEPLRSRWMLHFLHTCSAHGIQLGSMQRWPTLIESETSWMAPNDWRLLWEHRSMAANNGRMAWLERDFASCSEAERLVEAAGLLRDMALLQNLRQQSVLLASIACENANQRQDFHFRLLTQVTAAFCHLNPGQADTHLQQSLALILPEDQDQFRRNLALHNVFAHQAPMAERIAGTIEEGTLRTWTQMQLRSRQSGLELKPDNIYEVLADTGFLMDEWRMLAALNEHSTQGEILLNRFLRPIRNPSLQSRALFHLAASQLAREETFRGSFRHFDPWGALSLLYPKLGSLGQADHQLEALIWAVDMGCKAKPGNAPDEYEMAFNFMFVIEGASPFSLEKTFVALITGMQQRVKASSEDRGFSGRRLQKRWLRVAKILVALPNTALRDRYGDRQAAVRKHWLHLFPWLLCLEKVWPPKSGKSFRQWLIRQFQGYKAWWPAPKLPWLDWVMAPALDTEFPSIHLQDTGDQSIRAIAAVLRHRREPSFFLDQMADSPARENLAMLFLTHKVWSPADEERCSIIRTPENRAISNLNNLEEKSSSMAKLAAAWQYRPPNEGLSFYDRWLRFAWAAPRTTALDDLSDSVRDALSAGEAQAAKANLLLFLQVLLAPGSADGKKPRFRQKVRIRIANAAALNSKEPSPGNPLVSQDEHELKPEAIKKARILAVRWQKAAMQAFNRNWGRRRYALIAGFYTAGLGLAALSLDATLTSAVFNPPQSWENLNVDPSITIWAVAIVLMSCIASCFLTESYLARYETRSSPPWWPAIRACLSFFPFLWPLGLIFHFHYYRSLKDFEGKYPKTLALLESLLKQPTIRTRATGQTLFRFGGSWEHLVFFYFGLIPLLLMALPIWLLALSLPLQGGIPILILAVAVCHFGMFFMMRLLVETIAQGCSDFNKVRRLQRASWLCLVPIFSVPLIPFIFLSLHQFFSESLLREKTLTFRLFGNYSTRNLNWLGLASRLPQKRRLRLRGNEALPFRIKRRPSQRERALLGFIDFKLLCLFPEILTICATVLPNRPFKYGFNHPAHVLALSTFVLIVTLALATGAFYRRPKDLDLTKSLALLHPKAIWLPYFFTYLAFCTGYGAVTGLKGFYLVVVLNAFALFFASIFSLLAKGAENILNFRLKWEIVYPVVPLFVIAGLTSTRENHNGSEHIVWWLLLFFCPAILGGTMLWHRYGPWLAVSSRHQSRRDTQTSNISKATNLILFLAMLLPLGALLVPIWLWLKIQILEPEGARPEAKLTDAN